MDGTSDAEGLVREAPEAGRTRSSRRNGDLAGRAAHVQTSRFVTPGPGENPADGDPTGRVRAGDRHGSVACPAARCPGSNPGEGDPMGHVRTRGRHRAEPVFVPGSTSRADFERAVRAVKAKMRAVVRGPVFVYSPTAGHATQGEDSAAPGSLAMPGSSPTPDRFARSASVAGRIGQARELQAELAAFDLPPEAAFLMRTSGSTSGTGKIVILTTAALVASARATEEALGGPARWVTCLPTAHVAGFQTVFRSLLAGREPVWGGRGRPEDIAAAIGELEPGERACISLVPTQLARLLDADGALRAAPLPAPAGTAASPAAGHVADAARGTSGEGVSGSGARNGGETSENRGRRQAEGRGCPVRARPSWGGASGTVPDAAQVRPLCDIHPSGLHKQPERESCKGERSDRSRSPVAAPPPAPAQMAGAEAGAPRPNPPDSDSEIPARQTPAFASGMAGREGVPPLLARFDAILVGGAACPPGLVERAEAAGLRVVRTYGMTETCGGCVYDGFPIGDARVVLGSDGRIEISGSPVAFGYAGGEPFAGRFATSDAGRLAPDGRLEVLGRLDGAITSGGVTVVPEVVEAELAAAGCGAAVVAAVPDATWGEAVVALAERAAPDARERLKARLEPGWVPARVFTLAELGLARIPMLASGKPDRTAAAAILRHAPAIRGRPHARVRQDSHYGS